MLKTISSLYSAKPWAVIFVFNALFACDNVNKTAIAPGIRIDMMSSVFGTLPQIDSTFVAASGSDPFLNETFPMQCYNGADIDICPPVEYFQKINAGKTVDIKTTSDYKFIDGTPMKYVYLAYSELDMIYRTNDFYKTCSIANGAPIEQHGPRYIPEGSNLYFINFGDRKECLGYIMGSYYIYSASNTNDVLALSRATLGAEIKYSIQTDKLWSILQVYVRNNAEGKPRIIILNSVDYTESKHNKPEVTTKASARTTVIINLQNNKFVVKNIRFGNQLFGESIYDFRKALVAIGGAGWDTVANNWRNAHYILKASTSDYETALDDTLYCVSNDTQKSSANLLACNSDEPYLLEYQTSTSDAWTSLAAYLEISSSDLANISGLSRVFDDGMYLNNNDTTIVPSDASSYPTGLRP